MTLRLDDATAQVSIAAHTLIARQYGHNSGPHLNGINALFGAGSLLAPAVHRSLAPSLAGHGLLASYYVVSAAAAFAALPFVAPLLQRAAPDAGTGPSGGGAPAARLTRRHIVTTVLAMALVACNVGAENCFGTWLYTYGAQAISPSAASSAVSLFWAAFTAGRLLAIPVSAVASPSAILLSSLPLAVLAPVLILAWPGVAGALYAGAALAGLGISTGFANSVSLLTRRVPPSGTVQAAVQLAATAGSMTFPPRWRSSPEEEPWALRPSCTSPAPARA